MEGSSRTVGLGKGVHHQPAGLALYVLCVCPILGEADLDAAKSWRGSGLRVVTFLPHAYQEARRNVNRRTVSKMLTPGFPLVPKLLARILLYMWNMAWPWLKAMCAFLPIDFLPIAAQRSGFADVSKQNDEQPHTITLIVNSSISTDEVFSEYSDFVLCQCRGRRVATTP